MLSKTRGQKLLNFSSLVAKSSICSCSKRKCWEKDGKCKASDDKETSTRRKLNDYERDEQEDFVVDGDLRTSRRCEGQISAGRKC